MKGRRRHYGWIRDLPDHRDYDYVYLPPPEAVRDLQRREDLRSQCPPIHNQGQLESCTAHAIAAAIQFVRRKKHELPDFPPSRLFIYYNARARRHCERCDAGSQLRDGMKSVARLGVCPEKLWPYQAVKFEDRPGERCYEEAFPHRAVSYHRIRRAHDLIPFKACLASGYPFIFGMTLYESFEGAAVAHTGVAQLPRPGERHVGGHAVLAVGYNDAAERFIVRNSWGQGWGKKGYFTLPYEFFRDPNLTDDFWTIRLVQR